MEKVSITLNLNYKTLQKAFALLDIDIPTNEEISKLLSSPIEQNDMSEIDPNMPLQLATVFLCILKSK